MTNELLGLFRHIRTRYDRDPFASTYVRCGGCGHWDNAALGNSCCPICSHDYDDHEDTQRCGHYPPGWTGA